MVGFKFGTNAAEFCEPFAEKSPMGRRDGGEAFVQGAPVDVWSGECWEPGLFVPV